jgi:hypothetical protein
MLACMYAALALLNGRASHGMVQLRTTTRHASINYGSKVGRYRIEIESVMAWRSTVQHGTQLTTTMMRSDSLCHSNLCDEAATLGKTASVAVQRRSSLTCRNKAEHKDRLSAHSQLTSRRSDGSLTRFTCLPSLSSFPKVIKSCSQTRRKAISSLLSSI